MCDAIINNLTISDLIFKMRSSKVYHHFKSKSEGAYSMCDALINSPTISNLIFNNLL